MARRFFYFVRLVIRLDSCIEQLIKKYILKPKYTVSGTCKMCGTCCENIGIYTASYLIKVNLILKIIVKFYEKVNDFQYQGYLPNKKILVFTCHNFDDNKRKCKVHNKRPAMCRNYPLLRYFNKPVLIKNCGYKVHIQQ
jgi:Fe-S-cluster containining protein